MVLVLRAAKDGGMVDDGERGEGGDSQKAGEGDVAVDPVVEPEGEDAESRRERKGVRDGERGEPHSGAILNRPDLEML